jgi:hypothetical protein
MLAVYGLPLGLLAAGLLIPRVGYRSALTVGTTLGLVVTILIGLGWRAALWRALTSPLSSASQPSARRVAAVRPPPSTPDPR